MKLKANPEHQGPKLRGSLSKLSRGTPAQKNLHHTHTHTAQRQRRTRDDGDRYGRDKGSAGGYTRVDKTVNINSKNIPQSQVLGRTMLDTALKPQFTDQHIQHQCQNCRSITLLEPLEYQTSRTDRKISFGNAGV